MTRTSLKLAYEFGSVSAADNIIVGKRITVGFSNFKEAQESQELAAASWFRDEWGRIILQRRAYGRTIVGTKLAFGGLVRRICLFAVSGST